MPEEQDSALIRLAKVTRVKAHSRSENGHNVHVGAYLRKDLDSFGGGNGKTKTGAFVSPGLVDGPGTTSPTGSRQNKRDANFGKASGVRNLNSPGAAKGGASAKAEADLKADVKDYTGAMNKALDGEDVKVPNYRTKGPTLDKKAVKSLSKDIAKSVQSVKSEDIKQATEDAGKPAVQRLLAKTPVPVLAASLKSWVGQTSKKINRMKALTFAALVNLQHRDEKKLANLDHLSEDVGMLIDGSDPAMALLESAHYFMEMAKPVAEVLAPAMRNLLGLSADDDATVSLSVESEAARYLALP